MNTEYRYAYFNQVPYHVRGNAKCRMQNAKCKMHDGKGKQGKGKAKRKRVSEKRKWKMAIDD